MLIHSARKRFAGRGLCLLGLGLWASAAAGQGVAFVKDVGKGCSTNVAPGTPFTISVPAGGVAAGSTLVLWLLPAAAIANAQLVVTDSHANTYTSDNSYFDGTHNMRAGTYHAPIATALAPGELISVTPNAGPGSMCGWAVAFAGLDRLGPLDTTGSNTGSVAGGTTGAFASGPVAPTSQPIELIAGLAATSGSLPATSFANGAGYTVPDAGTNKVCTASGGYCLFAEFKITAAVESPNANGQITAPGGATQSWIAMHTSYKPASAKGDFNSDTVPDLLFQNASNGQLKAWLMNGTTRVGGEVSLTPNPASVDWHVVGVDDFDNALSPGSGPDHKTDLLVRNLTTAASEFWLLNGTSRPGAAVALLAPPAANWLVAATGDFNFDGHPDLLWRNSTSSKLVIWALNGTTKIGNIIPSPDAAVDANWSVVAALDYNLDGARDLLWYNSTTGKIVTWMMDANVVRIAGNFTNPTNAGDANWKVVAGGNYGDVGPGDMGGNDIVWRNDTSGNLVVWKMSPFAFPILRLSGGFTTPSAPTGTTAWVVAGPR